MNWFELGFGLNWGYVSTFNIGLNWGYVSTFNIELVNWAYVSTLTFHIDSELTPGQDRDSAASTASRERGRSWVGHT